MQPSLIARLGTALGNADDATRAWLRSNTRLLSSIGDLLHSLALLSPSAHAELRAEFAATAISILQIYRDYYPPATSNTGVIDERNINYNRLNLPRRRLLILNVITSAQLFLEMILTRRFFGKNHQRSQDDSDNAKHQQQRNRHVTSLTAIEAAKAALRLSLLWPAVKLGRQLTAEDQSLGRRGDSPSVEVCTCGLRQDVPDARNVNIDKGPRTDTAILRIRQHRTTAVTRRRLDPRDRPLSSANIAGLSPVPTIIGRPPSTPSSGNGEDPLLEALFVVAYERRSNWLVRLFMPDLRCAACSAIVQLTPPPLSDTVEGITDTVRTLTPLQIAAEVAYILRPVVHLLLIRRFGWRSWKAWVLALLTDLASRAAMPAPADENEVVERKRRMAHLVLYLGRSPLFDLILRIVIKKVTSPLRTVPIVGSVASSAIQWMTLLQQYWFYTSAS